VSEPTTAKRGLPLRVKMRHSAHFVDELASRHETPVGRLLPLSAIEANPDQPRTQVGDLSDLVASIREKGILEPILVRPLPAGEPSGQGSAASGSAGVGAAPTQFQIISGERRYRAALEAGLYEVPVIEMDVSEQEALEIALIENLQRKDLTAFEEAEGFRALGDRHDYTQEEIAKAVGKSRSMVAETLSLLAIPAELREEAMALGVTSRSTLLEIAKAGEPARMRQLLEKVGQQGLTRDELRRDTRGAQGRRGKSAKRRPYVFKFRSPDRTFQLNLTFRQSTVDRADLVRALEQILEEIRSAEE
jgi:ParB family transcriptional regulator, chromosome partitioning protein